MTNMGERNGARVALCAIGCLVLVGLAAGTAGAVTTVNSCTTINSSGVYELGGDITESSSDSCISITAGNVTFDGQNNTVDSDGSGSRGIDVTNGSASPVEVEVRNVTVSDWDTAVYTEENLTLTDADIPNTGGSYGINILGNGSTVRDTTVENTGDNGVRIEAVNVTLKDTSVSGTPSTAIQLRPIARDFLADNTTVSDASGNGVSVVTGADSATIVDSEIRNVQSDGILLDGDLGNVTNTLIDGTGTGGFGGYGINSNKLATIESNTIRNVGNGRDAINSAGPDTIIRDNLIESSPQGIRMSGFGSAAANNTLQGVGTGGIILESEFSSANRNNLTGSGIRLFTTNASVTENRVEDSPGAGIYVGSGGDSNTVSRNDVVNSTAEGILVDGGDSNDVEDNRVVGNGGVALTLAGTSTDNNVTDLDIGDSTDPNTTVDVRGTGITVDSVTSPPSGPSRSERNIDRYVNVTNTTADSYAFVNVSYQDSDVKNESKLGVWKYNDTSGWVNTTEVPGVDGVNTTANYVYTNTTEFSLIAPLETDQSPFFDVEITGTNSPVVEGETLTVDVNVTNTGNTSDTQTLNLTDFDGVVQDTETVSLSPGETNGSITLNWSTSTGDNGTGDVSVSSENETTTEAAEVQTPPFFDVNITGTNSPVGEGQVLSVGVNVTNTGDATDTQRLNLTDTGFNDTERDALNVTLAGGASNDSITLDWVTSDGDAGTGNVTVFSEDDTANDTVTVENTAEFRYINSCVTVDSRPPNGSIDLTRDITDSAAPSCINVTVSNVTLDGQNNTVDSDGNGSIGVYVNASSTLTNVTVRNLTTTDWTGAGIRYEDANRSRIAGVRTVSGDSGIVLQSTNTTNVTGSIVSSGQFGIRLFSSNRNNITGNEAKNGDRTEPAIDLASSDNNSIVNNTAEEEHEGIELTSGSSNNDIVDNRLTDQFGPVTIIGGGGNNVTENFISPGNIFRGVLVSSSNNNRIVGNTVENTRETGILIRFSNRNVVKRNLIRDIGRRFEGVALALRGRDSGITSDTDDNVVVNNTIRDSTFDGVLMNGKASDNDILNNDVLSNDDRGIVDTSDGNNNISGNDISANGNDGVRISTNGVSVHDNNVTSNAGDGVEVTSGSNNNVSSNLVSGNSNVGVRFTTGGAEAVGNEITNNAEGVRLSGAPDAVVSDNVVYSNNGDGISLRSSSDNATLARNNVTSNSGDGVLVNSTNNTTATGDTVTGNDGAGVSVAGGSLNTTFTDLNVGASTAANTALSFDARGVNVSGNASPPADPEYPENIGRYFEAENTTSDSFLNVSLGYEDGDVTDTNESFLRLLRYDGTEWTRVSGSTPDASENVVRANLTEFSAFGAFANPPFFDVNITGTNSEIAEGDVLTVDVNVTNPGVEGATQTLNLTDTEFTNSVQDTTNVTLAAGESNGSVTLEWNTTTGVNGTGNVTVFSQNTSDAQNVTVKAGCEAFDPVGGAINPPTDTDGDDLCDDVNGDSNFDLGDVSALYNGYEGDDTINNNPSFFDFNGDSSISLGDVISLYNEL